MKNKIDNGKNNYEIILGGHQTKLLRISWFVFLLVFTLIISAVDYFTGRYLTVFSLYIIPAIVATLKIGFKSGVFFSLLACLFGFITESALKPEASFLLLFSTAVTRLGALLLFICGYWKIKTLMQRLVKLSEEDPLTGVSNRRGFFIQGKIELERVRRAQRSISLAYIDLDNFKNINDIMGHDEGDKVLQKVAKVIKSQIRKIDFLARMGGDEFVIILPFTDSLGAMRVAKKIHSAIKKKL